MEHPLKIEQCYLDRLIGGTKTCELRYNDRDYQIGDTIKFWNSLGTMGVSCWLYFTVTHVLPVQTVIYNCDSNYVVLSLKPRKEKP